jgi:hypothetical protein
MCCKLLGGAMLVGALALGAVAYSQYTGCCIFTGEPINKCGTCSQPNTSPGETPESAPGVGLVRKGGKNHTNTTAASKGEAKAFFTSLAHKNQEGGCCGGDCCGGGCGGEGGDSKKTETAAQK